jgi:uncharacterized phiE125 gp8 family phage protein
MLQTKVTTDLVAEPVSLAEAKAFMEIDFTDFDDLITSLIKAARIASEKFTGLSYGTKTISLTAKNECEIQLPLGPVQTITSVQNTDGDDLLYQAFGFDNPVITLEVSNSFAGLLPVNNTIPQNIVNVVYETGFIDCPEDLKTAIKMRVETAFQYRADSTNEQVNKAINTSTELEFAYKVSPLFGLL